VLNSSIDVDRPRLLGPNLGLGDLCGSRPSLPFLITHYLARPDDAVKVAASMSVRNKQDGTYPTTNVTVQGQVFHAHFDMANATVCPLSRCIFLNVVIYGRRQL
jgi:hypothetical protein